MNIRGITLVKAIASGILIAIAGSVYLSVDNSYLGAFLFSFGLLVICNKNLNLYTGKVGYLFTEGKGYYIDVLLIIIGNIIGILLISLFIYFADIKTITASAKLLTEVKLSRSWLAVLSLSIPCGMLMYIAVEGFRKTESEVIKTLVVIMAVMIFIIVGFEHSIANIFYITISSMWSLKAILYVILMIVGNGIGAIIINFISRTISSDAGVVKKI